MKSAIISSAVIALVVGILVYGYANGYIVVIYPSFHYTEYSNVSTTNKKEMVLYYMQNHQWQYERVTLVWSDQLTDNMLRLVNAWLVLLEQADVWDKKVVLHHVLIVADQKTAYLSFDRNPFSKERSVYEKWMWIEGLLKTVRENIISISMIGMLVQHQPIVDNQLNMRNPWPVQGFLI